MTNLARAFCEMADGSSIQEKDDRIRGKSEFFGISYEDAMLLDNEVVALCRNMARIMGNRVDRLPPTLRNAALRNFPCTVSTFLTTMTEAIQVAVMGLPPEIIGWETTPGCDCSVCVAKAQFFAELKVAIKGEL